MTQLVLNGSLIGTVLIIIILGFYFLVLNQHHLLFKIDVALAVLLYLLLIKYLIQHRNVRTGAWLLVGLYDILGLIILHTWNFHAPLGLLILSSVVMIVNATLGPKHIIIATASVIVVMILYELISMIYMNHFNIIPSTDNPTILDIISYSVILSTFALTIWFSFKQNLATLNRALKAETELHTERDALAVRLEEQTRVLRDTQQKELKQLYKFAELGQLTTIILHELANYLSILTLDIEDLDDRHENSIAIDHAKESIFYIDTIIDQVRNQIRESDNNRPFNALATTKEAVEQLRKKLVDSRIKLFLEDDTSYDYTIFGDPLRLFQVITILVTNAAQAKQKAHAEISIEMSVVKSKLLISVKDFGKGINENTRRTLFEPHKSTKSSGLGIGLYITKQIIDTHFKGKIWLNPSLEYTQFNIEIPKVRNGHIARLPRKSVVSD